MHPTLTVHKHIYLLKEAKYDVKSLLTHVHIPHSVTFYGKLQPIVSEAETDDEREWNTIAGYTVDLTHNSATAQRAVSFK